MSTDPSIKYQALANAGRTAAFASAALMANLDIARAKNAELEKLLELQEAEFKKVAGAQGISQDRYAACETAYAGVKPVFEKFVDAVAPSKGSLPAVDKTAPETFLATLPDVFKHVGSAYNAVRMNVAAAHAAVRRLESEKKALFADKATLKADYDDKVAELDAAEKVLEVEARAKDRLLAEKSVLEDNYTLLEADKAQLESDYDAKSADFNTVRAAFVAEAKAKDALLAEKKSVEDKYALLQKAKDAQRVAYDDKHRDWMKSESDIRDIKDDLAKKTTAMSAVSAERDKLQSDADDAVSVLNGLLGDLDGIDQFFKSTAQGLHDKLAAYT